MALSKIEYDAQGDFDPRDGVLNLSEDNKLLTIDFSDAVWDATTAGNDSILGRSELLASTTGMFEGQIASYMQALWGVSGINAIDRYVFVTRNESVNVTLPEREGEETDKGTFFAGSDANDTIIGSASHELIVGGGGNDRLESRDEGDIIYGGAGNDTLLGWNGKLILDGGADNDKLLIVGNAAGSILYGGAGEDTLLGGNGSIVYGGAGADTFLIGQQYLIADVDSEDRLMFGGKVLTGGVRWEGSESAYAVGIDGTKYGINTAGELVVQAKVGKETYLAGFNNTLTGPYTAGILIGEMELESYRLIEGLPDHWAIDSYEAVMGYYLKALTGESHFGTVGRTARSRAGTSSRGKPSRPPRPRGTTSSSGCISTIRSMAVREMTRWTGLPARISLSLRSVTGRT